MDTVSFFKIFSAYPIVKMTNSAYDKIQTERKTEGKCEDHSGISGTPADSRYLPSG